MSMTLKELRKLDADKLGKVIYDTEDKIDELVVYANKLHTDVAMATSMIRKNETLLKRCQKVVREINGTEDIK